MMKFLARFLRRFRRLSALEISLLDHVEKMLREAERSLFRSQISVAQFDREWRSVVFSYPEPPPSIDRFAGAPLLKLAILNAKGKVSGFTVIATVTLAHGVLRSIDYNVVPWSHPEAVEINGKMLVTLDPPSSDLPA